MFLSATRKATSVTSYKRIFSIHQLLHPKSILAQQQEKGHQKLIY